MSAPFYDNEDFNEYLKQKVRGQRMYPSDLIWRNIQTTLHGQRSWPGLSVISIFIIAAITAGTILTKPNNHLAKAQYHPIISLNITATEKQRNTATEILHQHFSAENITEQTITAMGKSSGININNNDAAVVLPDPNSPLTNDAVSTFASTSSQAIAQANSPKPKISPVVADHVSLKEVEEKPVVDVQEINSYINDAIIPDNVFSFMSTVPMPKKQNGLLMQSSFNMNTRYTSSYARKYITLNFLNRRPSSNNNYYKQNAKGSKLSIQFYTTPSVSYRRLTDAATGHPASSFIPQTPGPVITNNPPTVHNSPAIGIEAGFALGYKITDQLTFKTGLQYNMRQYNITAYNHPAQTEAIGFLSNNSPDTINLVSRNNDASSNSYQTTLNNRYYEVSIPIGIDWKVATFDRFSIGVAGFVQPTYTFNRHSFLITTDLKNYVNGSSLLRQWNINTSVESYIAYKMGDYTLQAGPELRYQQLPSFSSQYPIKEFLIDYGFKVGVTKAIK